MVAAAVLAKEGGVGQPVVARRVAAKTLTVIVQVLEEVAEGAAVV